MFNEYFLFSRGIGLPRSAAARNLSEKKIDKQEAEIKKKMKGEAQKAFMKCGSRHKKARSRKLFHLRVERWGTFKIKHFKPKQSSVLVSKAKNWTENHRKDQNLYSRIVRRPTSGFEKTVDIVGWTNAFGMNRQENLLWVQSCC